MRSNLKRNLYRPLSRRDFLRLSGAAFGGALLAACGAPAPTEPPSAATAVPATAVPVAKKFAGTLDVWDWEFPARETVVKASIAEWEKANPDVKINYLVLPWADMETKILAVATTGTAPPISDIMYFWRYDLQRADAILPYPENFLDWSDRLSAPFMKDAEGRIRALPSGWFVDMIYYNKDIFEKEGLKAADIPGKWEDFIKLAQQLTQKDSNGVVTHAGCAMNDYWQHEYLWQDLIYQQGGWMYSADGKQALWEDEPSVKSLQFIQDWYHKHQIDSRDLPEGYGGFCNDLAVMFMGSGWNTGFFMSDFPQMEGRWDTVRLPTFTGDLTPSVGLASPEENFQVFAGYPDETAEASFEFIKQLMTGEEQEIEWTKAQSSAPNSIKLGKDPRILEIPGIKAQAETMPFRVCFGERPIEAEKLWRTMFDKVVLEKGDVKAALQEANTGINPILPSKERIFTERNYSPPD